MKTILLGALCIAAVSAQDAYAQHGVRKYAQVQTGDMNVPAGTTPPGAAVVIRGNLYRVWHGGGGGGNSASEIGR